MTVDHDVQLETPFPETSDVETSSDAYALRFSGSVGQWLLGTQEKLATELINSITAKSVLDVGGGHGQIAIPLCRRGHQVTVTGSAESCRHRLGPAMETGRCKFRIANVIDLPFENNSFDVAIAFRLVTHCAQWRELLAELCRVSRHGVIFDYPTSQSLNQFAPSLFGFKKKIETDTREWALFQHDQIAHALRDNGFGITGRRKQFFLPMVVHRMCRLRFLSQLAEQAARMSGFTRRWGTPVIVRAEPGRLSHVHGSGSKDSARNVKCGIPTGTRVLVTGATGFTGAVLTRKLVNAGLEVRAIARESSRTSHLSDLPIEWLRGEVHDPGLIRTAMDGVEYVFHLAAAFRDAKSLPEDYHNVHVMSTQLIAQEAIRSPTFRRLVHTSTIGVHGHIEGKPADEESPMAPGDDYQRTKAEAEHWLRAYASETGLAYTIIRPAAIYGPTDQRLLKFFRMANRGVFFLLGFGACSYHLIHVEDLTNVMLLSATNKEATGRAFIAGNSESIPLGEMAKIIAKELNRGIAIVRIPALPFFWAAWICEAICLPLGIEPPIYRRRVAFFTKDRKFNTNRIRETFGYEMIPNEEGLIATTRWYREQNWL